MGVHPAPSYANVYLSKRIDQKIKELAKLYEQNGTGTLKLFKRFLDDILKFFVGTTKQLHNFYNDMNKIHPNLKFTLKHTAIENEAPEDKCTCEESYSIPFLDTSLSLKDGRIEVDLYKKPTDRNQYLLPTSCHPKSTTKNLPFSLALRIVRICTDPKQRDQRLRELKILLMARKYNESVIDTALNKAANIPRKCLLQKTNKKKNQSRQIFATKFDPRLPCIQPIQNKHWRSMVKKDQYLAKVFPQPPMTGYRKQRNLKNYLIKSKVPPPPKRTSRNLKGMSKCGKSCANCPYVKEGKEVKINNKDTWKINKEVNCETYNCIYLIECQKDNCKLK